jgi:transcriptional regulator with XRE-family HTH domain
MNGAGMKKKRITKMNARRVQDSNIAIGERIRGRRTQIEMSQEDLGGALGVSFQQIQKYEKGVNRLSSGRLIQLASALQCSVTDLIGGGDKGSIKSTPFSRYAASKEGVAIINAMAKIQSAAVRRQVISLAECLSASF